MKLIRRLVFPLLCALISTGCATAHRPIVNTWRDPQFSPSPTNTIAFTLPVNPKPVDTASAKLLATELQREGFILVPEDRADYLLNCVVSENLEEHTWVDHNSSPTVGGTPSIPPQTTAQTAAGAGPAYLNYSEVRSYQFQTRDIRLFLYNNPKTHPGGLRLVWQGGITIGSNYSPEREQILLKTLLHYFGTDQNGGVPLIK